MFPEWHNELGYDHVWRDHVWRDQKNAGKMDLDRTATYNAQLIKFDGFIDNVVIQFY